MSQKFVTGGKIFRMRSHLCERKLGQKQAMNAVAPFKVDYDAPRDWAIRLSPDNCQITRSHTKWAYHQFSCPEIQIFEQNFSSSRSLRVHSHRGETKIEESIVELARESGSIPQIKLRIPMQRLIENL